MHRWSVILAPLFLALAAPALWADAFDYYTNPVLDKVPHAKGVKELKRLTPDLIADNDHVLPDVTAAFVVVQTNEGRYSKLLVQSARRKLGANRTVPILLIDRFVTFREGDERAVQASGKNLNLFNGFRLNLDIGQLVPSELVADVRFVAEDEKAYLEPSGKAKLYLLTQPLPEAKPPKGTKLVLGPTFELRYFNGTYKLYDDGRRSGTLKLTVADDGTVKGDYYSDADGRKYEVAGKIGTPKHAIDFVIRYPRTEEEFHGWLFTGDAKALAGTARMQSRETGFYAVRVEE